MQINNKKSYTPSPQTRKGHSITPHPFSYKPLRSYSLMSVT